VHCFCFVSSVYDDSGKQNIFLVAVIEIAGAGFN
jgi:hypothetical protein